jgi:UDP-N-acetylglucosamine acyltransferase
MKIHPTAIIDSTAQISETAVIGPYCIIGKRVKIGEDTILHSHVILEDETIIGEKNEIFQGVVIGTAPQDLSWRNEVSRVVVGNGNLIREYVTIHKGSGGKNTIIGDGNYIMAYVHAGHNVKIGSRCIIANSVGLAGYVELEDKVVMGGMAAVHQFVKIGTMAMVGGYSKNVKDIPPYVKVDGIPSRAYGLNLIALKRNEIPLENRELLKKAYNFLYRSGYNLCQAVEAIEHNLPSTVEIERFLHFLRNPSRQGILSREFSKKAGYEHENGADREVDQSAYFATEDLADVRLCTAGDRVDKLTSR